MRSARFTREMAEAMVRLNASVAFDRRLYNEDIDGSLAWARALARAGRIEAADAERIAGGLERIREEIANGSFPFQEALEDIHMNIEARLRELIGEPAERLHTGRSRNDQVATDLRLYLKRAAQAGAAATAALASALVEVAEREADAAFPAYTHLQRAQPVLFAHHLLAYAEMFLRDRDRFIWAAGQADACPLGSGACAGNQFGVDRELLRKELGFARLTHNSLDAVSDRDFALDYLHAAALCLMHLSRLGEDVILWSSSEFGFVTLDDAVTSGSSMLPHKKNADACELGRGKCGRVAGHWVALLMALKGLPLAYNKDLQEDKEGVFDTVDTLSLLLPVFAEVVRTMEVHRERMQAALEEGHLEAMGIADYLTRKGVPFRRAHEVAGRAVLEAERSGKRLAELPLEFYRTLHPGLDEGLYQALSVRAALEDKDVVGGTAPRRVEEEIRRLQSLLAGL